MARTGMAWPRPLARSPVTCAAASTSGARALAAWAGDHASTAAWAGHQGSSAAGPATPRPIDSRRDSIVTLHPAAAGRRQARPDRLRCHYLRRTSNGERSVRTRGPGVRSDREKGVPMRRYLIVANQTLLGDPLLARV